MTNPLESSASLEVPEDAGKGKEGIVKRWMMELALAEEAEKKWRKSADDAFERYRNEKSSNGFNILWANTEVIQPNVYNSKPRPDVRQRFPSQDAVGKSAAEIVERSLSTMMDDYDFDHVIEMAIFDMLVPGRGLARVKYVPYTNNDKLVAVETPCEHVQWDDFRHGAGKTWEQVPWIAYRHLLTREALDQEFPALSAKIPLEYTTKDTDQKKANENPDVFKRACIWEILDKQKRETIFIAEGYTEAPVKVEPDKLKLRGFFDCPRPLMSIFDSSTLVPKAEYEMYSAQAKELDKLTTRINKLIDALKYRGFYDSTISELKDLANLEDGAFRPTQTSLMAMQAGGLDKAIWVAPTEEIAKTLIQLYQAREQVRATIYEIMGIADIMRGSSDPGETLGAQELKAQTGSVRMRRRQKEAQRFIRDLLRLKAEIISEHYTPEQLADMSSVKLPTAEQKQMAMMAAQQGDQKAMELASKPSWDEVMQLLRNDMARRFNIDIETDSTIAADRKADREDAVEVIEGIGGFIQNIGPAVQSGAVSMEATKKILVSVIRKAKLGREVEEAIEADAMNKQQQQQKPDPEMMKLQAQQQADGQRMQFEAKKHQDEMAHKAQQAQIDGKATEADLQRKQRESEAMLQLKQQEASARLVAEENQRLIDNAMQERAAQAKEREIELKHAEAMAKIQMDAQVKMEAVRIQAENDNAAMQHKAKSDHEIKLKRMESGVKEPEEKQESGAIAELSKAVQALIEHQTKPRKISMKTSAGKTLTAIVG